MASTSCSSIRKSFKYDVFLSFRGEDTRKNFVDHLYRALKHKGIQTYRDDEAIKKGKRIGEQLIRSIEDSRFYIIVFSKNYASSSWCLGELVKIIECQETSEHTAYPVFYDVEPTEVRKQIGAVGEAFAKLKDKEFTGKWREALRAAADLAGWVLRTTFDGHEAMFIQNIVKEISLELQVTNLSSDGKLVGIKERVKDVISSLEIDNDDVRMIGIRGIGGGGKTTLAKTVFDHISHLYEGSSFLENVKGSTKVAGLKSLQKQVLSDVLRDPSVTLNDVSNLKRTMHNRKVLIVLDDVDHLDQLDALAGETSWFKPGSRVIITIREEQVLIAHKVPKNFILDVNLLSPEEANRLFSRYAFGTEIPDHGFEMLSYQFVQYAAGLPLTIKVLGSLLCGKDELEWMDELERLKTIPLIETQNVLEISYNSLENDRKEIFLDVACMLIGWHKETAIMALESQGFHARSGLKVLEQKSLITISHDGHLSMHDHIEEMGKNIVRRLYPNEPHKHSRLWITWEVEDVFVKDKGTLATSCIRVLHVDPLVIMKGLQKMTELRFLHVESASELDIHFNEDDLYLPNSLKYLFWHGYPFRCLPKSFQANNLVGLQMQYGNIDQLWERGERKDMKKLKFIDFYFCKLRTLDIRLIFNLERLNLYNCDLVKLHMPLRSFKLKFLNINSCKVRTLDLSWAENLVKLSINKCTDLVELHMPIECLELSHVYVKVSKLKTLDLTRTPNLEVLDVTRCEDLIELHMPVKTLKLKHLELLRCSKLKTLDLAGNPNLEVLDVTECEDLTKLLMPVEMLKLKILQCSKLKTVDLTRTENLEKLSLEECEDLVERHIPSEMLKLEHLKLHQPFKLKTLNLTGISNPRELDLKECEHLEELRMPVGTLTLKHLKLLRCPKLETLDLKGCSNLEVLDVTECEDLIKLHMPIAILNLKLLMLLQCSKLKTLNLTGTLNLEKLSLTECENLVELCMSVEMLKLEHLILHQVSKLKTLNLTAIPNLTELDMKECEDLEEVSMPIETLKLKHLKILRCPKLETLDLKGSSNLEVLDVTECEDLIKLHMPVEMLKLGRLTLHQCFKLKTLNLMRASNLEELDLEECKDLIELHMPVQNFELKFLKLCQSKLRTLDLAGARGLWTLNVKECEDLVELHMPMESPCLSYLNLEHCKLKILKVMKAPDLLYLKDCEDLRTLHLGPSPYLNLLNIEECYNLVEIHNPIGHLNDRVHIYSSSCARLNPFLVNQGSPMVLAELHLVTESLAVVCKLHPPNNVHRLMFEYIYKEPVPSLLGIPEKLISVGVYTCTNLATFLGSTSALLHLRKLTLEGSSILEVPIELEQLECLEELNLLSTDIVRLPDSVCMLKHLKVLRLKSCLLLEQLPEDIGRLKCLEELHLTECMLLQHIPNSICEMKRLKCFHLTKCYLVEKLPKEIGRLKCLKELSIESTRISVLPGSISQLKDLRIIGSTRHNKLYGITSVKINSKFSGFRCM